MALAIAVNRINVSSLCTGQKFQREQEIIHFELNVKNDGAQVV
jgi:hypothetical protein